MDDNYKEKLEALRQEALVTRRASLVVSFSGIAAIPFAFLGIAIGNNALSVGALCWLVSHFMGYTARMLQEEQKQYESKLSLIESSAAAARQVGGGGPIGHRISLN